MRAVIFANGIFEKSNFPLRSLHEDDLLIAADGGAEHFVELGLTPSILIGDMDSISPSLLNILKDQGSQSIVYPQDKDQTDLELALNFAVGAGAREILLLGVIGGRLDQTLANLMLLTREDWQGTSMVILDPPDTAYLMRDHDNISLNGKPGDIVSLIPLTQVVTGVSTQGLRWPLEDAELTLGNTISVSNEMVSLIAQIEIGIGKLLLIHRDI